MVSQTQVRFKTNAGISVRESVAALFVVGAIVLLVSHYSNIVSPRVTADPAGMDRVARIWLWAMVGGAAYLVLSMLTLLPFRAVRDGGTVDVPASYVRYRALLGWTKVALMAGLLLWLRHVVR